MSVRIQVIVDKQEREQFQRCSRREGLSLSAWLRAAALDRINTESKQKMKSVNDLATFFKECDRRESGREPDWEDHLIVMQGSQTARSMR